MTTPYVTGTVSVTAGSAVVTGAGTGWDTSGLIAGEFGVDGLSVPVLSIDSNTKITLAQPWPGATASGKAYWISYDTTPGQQTVANAQKLAEYIARLDKPALAALASLVPEADKLPYFGAGGAAAMVDFNAAARELLAGTGALPNTQLPGRLRVTGGVSADANTITDNGWYVVASTAGNLPEAQPGVIVHSVISSQFMVQEYTRRGTNIIYQRSSSGGVWGAWIRIVVGDSSGVILSASLPGRIRGDSVDATTDFDNAIENGFYLGGTASVNAPATGVRLALLSQYYSSAYVVQTCWQIAGNPRGWTRTRFNNVWSEWRLFGLQVIGTVSQSAGAPTGAIVERGSNANGEYTRFADGTQICRASVTKSFDITNAQGAFFRSSGVQWAYPSNFVATPIAIASFSSGEFDIWTQSDYGPSATGGAVEFVFMSGTLKSAASRSFKALAIGRWF